MYRSSSVPPRICALLLQCMSRYREEFLWMGDLEEEYIERIQRYGLHSARYWFRRQVMRSLPAYLKHLFIWRIIMFKNYLVITLRNFRRHKGFSFINICGLSLGLAAAVLIFLWVQQELSYDRFHTKSRRIHRILLSNPEKTSFWPQGMGPLGPALQADYPEIEESVRMFYNVRSPLHYGDRSFYATLCGVDKSFFKVFDFKLLQGKPDTALADQGSIVLTSSTARKFFDDEDPMGKTMRFEWWGTWHNFTVTGVIEDVPAASHLQFDYLLPISFVTLSGMSIDSWDVICYHTYVLLHEGSRPETVAPKITDIIPRYSPQSNYLVQLEPLAKIHLFSSSGGGASFYVAIFSAIGLLILLIATINFMSLATARSLQRAREVGIRKVVGSRRSQLVFQFLQESLLLTLVAMVLAVVMVKFFLPRINSLLGTDLVLTFSLPVILILLGITILTGLFAGSYPAIFLSAFTPFSVLSGSHSTRAGKSRFRRIFVIFQFALTVLLLVGSLMVYRQLEFVRTKDMGINKEFVVNFDFRGGLRKKFTVVKNELLQNPNILSISMANASFSKHFASDKVRWEGQHEDDYVGMAIHSVDYDFLATLGLEMVQGRYFSQDFPTDLTEGIIVNQTAAQLMGLDDPIGKRIFCTVPFAPDRERQIVGVVKDYHFWSLYNSIPPLLLLHHPGWMTDVYVRFKPGSMSVAMVHLENVVKKHVPDYPFEFRFLDETIDRLYQTEKQAGMVIRFGTIMAVFIACLGLFGLASYTAEQRTKEIGIRKVMGASIPGIAALITRDLTKWVVLANLISWPVAYLVVHRWLQSFAYRSSISFWIFLVAAGISILIAVLTVSYQSIKAALLDPVESLRYE